MELVYCVVFWNIDPDFIVHYFVRGGNSCNFACHFYIKGEALRFLRTNYSQFTFEENMSNFKTRLQNRDYSARLVEKHFSEIKFSDKEMSLAQKILPFVTQYHLTLPNLKDTLMGKWHLIENQPQLREIFKEPPSSHIVRENP